MVTVLALIIGGIVGWLVNELSHVGDAMDAQVQIEYFKHEAEL